MENRFEHNPPEEKQGWGAYVTPPVPGQQSSYEQMHAVPALPHDLTVCKRVQENLPFLLENEDGEISAETSRALYGHLSICEACSNALDEHQRIVRHLRAMPPVELPMDFSGVVQRRIQIQSMPPQSEAVVTPAARRAFGAQTTATQTASTESIGKRSLASRGVVLSTLKKTHVSTTRQFMPLEQGLIRRLGSGAVSAALMASLVSSGWGRGLLGENLVSLRALLDQIGAAFGKIPVLGSLALLLFTAVAQVGNLLGDTYRTVGDMAVRGLAMDIGVCMAAYYFLVARKQRDSAWMRRA